MRDEAEEQPKNSRSRLEDDGTGFFQTSKKEYLIDGRLFIYFIVV